MICVTWDYAVHCGHYGSKAVYCKSSAACIIHVICCEGRAGPHRCTVGKRKARTGHAVIYRIYGNRHIGSRYQCHISGAGNTRTRNKECECVVIVTAIVTVIFFRSEYIIEFDRVSGRNDIELQYTSVISSPPGKGSKCRISGTTEICTCQCAFYARNR